ncbi:MAG TPA: glutamate racemase [Actinomycetaceae bacterium]|nr:glutamate racemase [Actinomycetaceae bacterium]
MRDAPIGVFDSGVGGLTVARAILDQLPQEPIVYIGDTAHGPYGPRPLSEVRELSLHVMDQLVAAGVKQLVIACNTASAAVLAEAQERYTHRAGVPIVEVIQPAVRRAVAATRSGRIGVIGTEATVGSQAYPRAFAAAGGVTVTQAAAPRFVEFVERGITSGPEVLEVARQYLEPIRCAGVDTLVLGCTHYPLLTAAIAFVMGEEVTLVSSAEETAKDTYRSLLSRDLARPASAGPPQHRFAVTGDPVAFRRLARRFLGPEVGHVHASDELGVQT